MDTEPAFASDDLFRYALGDMAKAVSERSGENEVQQFARCQAAAHMIMGFLPRDVIEVMLAGHCVMLHEVMKADVHDSLCGEASGSRRSLIALNKAFNDDLDRLERYRQRPSDDGREVPPVGDIPASPLAPVAPIARPAAKEMNRAARREAARAAMRVAAAGSRAASRQADQVPQRIIPLVRENTGPG